MNKSHESAVPPGRLRREYDEDFKVSEEYLAGLPDTQNLRAEEIQGRAVPLAEVGSANIRVPLKLALPGGKVVPVEARASGFVSLAADRKGINMSRILRGLYERLDEPFDSRVLHRLLEAYLERIGGSDARLRLACGVPLWQESLRSGEGGFQYYDCVFEGRLNRDGTYRRFLGLDFVYSSACPCSTDLSEHAAETREVFAVPHSQRSKARVFVELGPDEPFDVGTLVGLCRGALRTETQVMVRRPDEQAFAELNGAFTKFVEDAVRLLFEALDDHPGFIDFRIACSHLESLHSHDAVASTAKGVPGGMTGSVDDYRALVC